MRGISVCIVWPRTRAIATVGAVIWMCCGTTAEAQTQPDGAAGSAVTSPRPADGSGTSWQPIETPMYAVHGRRGSWDLMGHGTAFLQHLSDTGERGRDQFGSINWLMGMAERPFGGGRLRVKGMFSLEPWTIRGCGYPDLLASGETCDGESIVDQQHPHDLFMELAAQYDRRLNDSMSLQIYAGPAGEPALGPVAFPHRASAMFNPLAPISHHWLDATHITFGVATAALYGRRWKAEASAFNGREPDGERLDLDLARLDSFSGRLWWLPSDRLALQVSAGRLNEAEGDDTSLTRVTASATYHRSLGGAGGTWASTIAWGLNHEDSGARSFVLGETSASFDDRDAVFARIDAGRKDAHDLDLESSASDFLVAKMQAGYVRNLGVWRSLKPGIGGSVSLSILPSSLASTYGGRVVPGFGVFLTIRPAAMTMGADPHAGHRMP